MNLQKRANFPPSLLVCVILGPKVVSNKISVESIEEVSSVLKRAPVIWDNIHANDYDLQRLFLGPYKVKWKIIVTVPQAKPPLVSFPLRIGPPS